MKLKLICERFYITPSMINWVDKASVYIVKILTKELSIEEYDEEYSFGETVTGPNDITIPVDLYVLDGYNIQDHFECQAVRSDEDNFGYITVTINVNRKSVKYDIGIIKKILLHELVHIFDVGLEYQNSNQTTEQYHLSNVEMLAEFSAIAKILIPELLQKYTKEQVKELIRNNNFKNYLYKRITNGHTKTGLGKFKSHIETYINNTNAMKKLFRYLYNAIEQYDD